MKVLILSCNTGEGHNSCGTSLLESFKIRNIPCEMVDALGFISPLVSRTVSYGFTRIYRYVPSLFGRGYSYAEEHDSRLFSEKSPVYRLITIGADKLYEYIKNGGYDTIICPHVFTALMMTEILRHHDISVKTCYISTDYTCSPSCGDSELDMYFIPDESLRKEFVGCGVPDEKIIASGIPVRHEFAETLGKAEARR
ncbi:MAG: polysaccharide biosynthesis protein, partial [Eubacteriaceae bacterium]|nr:polysaccharide biosynthesis protein [Eubacteriaceae bacterium]